PPASTAWAETQSMFLDTVFSSLEWRTRYAVNSVGEAYPFDLFERKLEKIYPLLALDMMSIQFVINFERQIYEARNLSSEKVLKIARQTFKKYYDLTEDSLT